MKALIVDDDRVLADVVAYALRREGFQVIQAYDGTSALQRWEENQPDLILLDINLPGMDGFEICQHIRKQAETPIIMLSVRCEDEDVVHGLQVGADDYMTKPFSPKELVARVHTVLRRAGSPLFAATSPGKLHGLPNHRALHVRRGQSLTLTRLERRLFECLSINVGQVMSFDAIIDQVWGSDGGDREKLRQLVRRLRSKIEQDPSNPLYIKTVPGQGYGLVGDHEIV